MKANRSSKIAKIGAIGEQLVLNYLLSTREYEFIDYSGNPYDMHKDLIATLKGERIKIECKVRTVIRKYYALPLGLDQWYKVDNADRFFFVTSPTSIDELIAIYEATSKDYFVLDAFGPKNQRTRMYDIAKMKKITTISDPEIVKKMYDLSVSTYKQ